MKTNEHFSAPLIRRAYDISEVAGMLGVSVASVYRLVHGGKLRPLGLGQFRFSDQEIDRFLKVTRDVSVRRKSQKRGGHREGVEA